MGHGYDSFAGMGHSKEAKSENPLQVAWPETLKLVAKALRGRSGPRQFWVNACVTRGPETCAKSVLLKRALRFAALTSTA